MGAAKHCEAVGTYLQSRGINTSNFRNGIMVMCGSHAKVYAHKRRIRKSILIQPRGAVVAVAVVVLTDLVCGGVF
jgi:hypothetical protein